MIKSQYITDNYDNNYARIKQLQNPDDKNN